MRRNHDARNPARGVGIAGMLTWTNVAHQFIGVAGVRERRWRACSYHRRQESPYVINGSIRRGLIIGLTLPCYIQLGGIPFIPHSVGNVTVMRGIFNALSVHLGVCTTNNQRGLYPSMYASALGRRHRAQVDANRWSVATAT